jgi:hypothetical protein
MNKNKLLLGLFHKKELRNAFICLQLLRICKSREVNQMKKAIAAILIAIFAVSAFSAVSIAVARPFLSWNSMNIGRQDEGKGFGMGMGNGIRNQLPTQQSFVRIDGRIIKFGDANVTGTIQAQSRTVVVNGTTRQGSSVTAMLTNSSKPMAGPRDKQNFTYTVYTAKLVNASTASLNTTGYSFFLNGTWNVFQVTTNYTVVTDSSGNILSFNRNTNGVAVATGAYGELKVASTGSNFTLTITGVNALTGLVHVQRISSMMFNPFTINNDVTSTTVTKADVASVVSAYGSSPGWGNYDQRMDYNMHYKIDITDLATAAANVNSS